ncbi:putative fasciclin-like arabinogalactan protein 20 [Tasmannia lanceolata]|uniref:putative fasciclin-like arabinogalactan protein 20 n=1 Tax=Tasmannia lanceolata TaxID=3420 RepID=UPI00406399B6
MAIFLLLSLLFFSLISPSSSISPSSESIPNAVEILSNSGFTSMALTLQLTSQTLIPESSSTTIFSPSDNAFISSGQPSLNLLQYHFSAFKFTLQDLRSLPFGATIPTLFQNHSLIVTTLASDSEISLNNVKINDSIIYDDGSLIIYGIERFFDPSFQISTDSAPSESPRSDPLSCMPPYLYDSSLSGSDSFYRASELLKSRDYSVMSSFLDAQLLELQDQMKITVFAPMDAVLTQRFENFSDSVSFFKKHVVPCRLTWTDLDLLNNETELQTLSKGFSINVTRSGDILVLNGIPVIFPDMYYGELLVVHGLRQVLTAQVYLNQSDDSFSGIHGYDKDKFSDYAELGH